MKSNAALASLLVIAFLFLGLIGVMRHEMWRDELQAWLTARDSTSIADLFENLRYTGHAGLWYLPLYGLSRFTRNPVAMQLTHLMFAGIGVYLFARFSPLTNGHKILFSFSYSPFYRYALISSDYVLGVLLLFLFCGRFEGRARGYFLLWLLAVSSLTVPHLSA